MCFTVHFYDSTILFQQMHNLIFIYDKLGLHVSAYQAIIRAPITKKTENTTNQNFIYFILFYLFLYTFIYFIFYVFWLAVFSVFLVIVALMMAW